VTADIKAAVHYRYVRPLLATGRIPNSGEVAERLGVPVEDARPAKPRPHARRRPAHTRLRAMVIHPFSATPTATWVESGDRGWWATCMWCACGVATLVGGDATVRGSAAKPRTSTSMSRRAGCASPICGCISRRGTPGTASTISARLSWRSAVEIPVTEGGF